MEGASTDFVSDKSNSCFLCRSAHNLTGGADTSEHSIRSLSRYLELEELFPLQLKSKGKRSRRLKEKLEMEVTSCLDLIREKLLLGVRAEMEQDAPGEDDEDDVLLENLNIFNTLRTEALRQCCPKLMGIGPRVKIRKLAKQTVAKYERSSANPPLQLTWIKTETENWSNPVWDNGSPLDESTIDADLHPDNCDKKVFMSEEAEVDISSNSQNPLDLKPSLELLEATSEKEGASSSTPRQGTKFNGTQDPRHPNHNLADNHPATAEKCHKCGKRFSNRSNLFKHQRRRSCHARKRPHAQQHRFQCRSCGSGFTQRLNLKRHIQARACM